MVTRRGILLALMVVVILVGAVIGVLTSKRGEPTTRTTVVAGPTLPAISLPAITAPTDPPAAKTEEESASISTSVNAITRARAVRPGGIVTNQGAPVAGARVYWMASFDQAQGFFEPSYRDGAPVTTTDAKGAFSFAAADNPKGTSQFLVVVAEGLPELTHLPGMQSEFLRGEVAVVFPVSESLEGRVVTEANDPIAGADVVLDSFVLTPDGKGVTAFLRDVSRTAADGTFTLRGRLPEAKSVSVGGRARGYVRAALDVPKDSTDPVVIKLTKAGAAVAGLVLDHERKPVAGVTVTAVPQSPGPGHGMGGVQHAGGAYVADAKGRFRADNLPPGRFQFTAMRGPRGGGMISQSITIPASGEVSVELVFLAPVQAAIRILERETGNGMGGVLVAPSSFFGDNGEPVAPADSVATNAAGEATLALPIMSHMSGQFQSSTMYIQVPEGWLVDEPNVFRGAVQMNPVTPGGTVQRDVYMTRSHITRITVLQTDGKTPVAGESLTIERRNPQGYQQLQTDAEGIVKPSLAAHASYEVKIANGEGWLAEELTTGDQPPAELVYTLKPYGAIVGRVINEAGDPVAGAVVRWSNPVLPGFSGGSMSIYAGNSAQLNAVSEADGRFTLIRVKHSRVNLVATPPAENPAQLLESDRMSVALGEGETVRDVTLTLRESLSVIATVVDTAGKPIANAEARWRPYKQGYYTAYSESESGPKAVSDAEGRFVISGLSDDIGISNLEVTHPDFSPAHKQRVMAVEGDFRVVMEPKAGLTLAVVDEVTGAPVGHYLYLLFNDAWSQWSAQTSILVKDPDGITELESTGGGIGGRRVVVAELDAQGNPTGRLGSATFTPPAPGKSRQVIVQIGRTATVSGKVVNEADQTPVAGATVRQHMPPWAGRSALTGPFALPTAVSAADGSFELAGLTEGTYELVAELAGIATPEPVVVEIGDDRADVRDVVVPLASLGSVRGQVLDREGKPIVGVRVYTFPGNGSVLEATTDNTGRYIFTKLAAGDYTFGILEHSGIQQGLTLAPGENATLDFDLSKTIEVHGVITINGKQWSADPQGPSLSFRQVGKQRNTAAVLSSPSGYRAHLTPGEWQLRLYNQQTVVGTSEPVTINAQPSRQEHHFTLITAAVDVAIVMPEGEVRPPGTLSLDRQNGEMVEEGVLSVSMDGDRMHLPDVMAGTYRAHFTSYRGAVTATSEFQDVQPGRENVFVLFPKEDPSKLNELGRVQKQLTTLGYDPGPVDGLMGPMTGNAIRRFQGDEGLPVTGQPDDATKRRLDQKAPL